MTYESLHQSWENTTQFKEYKRLRKKIDLLCKKKSFRKSIYKSILVNGMVNVVRTQTDFDKQEMRRNRSAQEEGEKK